ncbi:hypothetical protein MSG28_008780 [Choristoneura fumiferana]|uniref:Uncharacterized protein n=1 Tax=Choristoneura fumiferana TaxID=7141 RepID=A0ACC0J869_CHOFU|nr:hypothetical protein MSG28_008780 [Choristoneura fumiferana]
MDIIALVKEGLQAVAEHVVSYKMGQTLLRHVDKALWVVEKCARWAVPPPLDPEERPQPELVRPLPWVFFLMLLVALRATRESISLVNLVLGKPPLRSADVVTYIQSKRRYLRTLKYQGNRMMRARIVTVQEPWYSGLRSLFEFTMCFKRQSIPYGNNNTTSVSNNDEVLLTNVTSVKSDRSEGTAESDHEEVTNEVSTNSKDTQDVVTTPPKEDSNDKVEPEQNTPPMPVEPKTPTKEHVEPAAEKKTPPKSNEDLALRSFDRRSPILDSKAFLQSEKQPCNQRSPKQKIELPAVLLRYIVFYTPFDVGYKVAKFLPVKVVASAMKEIYRAKKVYDGVSHAGKLYPNAYLIMIIIVDLVNAGHEVVAIDNFANAVGDDEGSPALRRVEEITGKKVTFYKADLLNKSQIGDIFDKHPIDCVIHFAALKAVGESMQQPLLYYQNNLLGMLNLLEYEARRLGDITAMWADATLAKNELHWVTKHTIEEMLIPKV